MEIVNPGTQVDECGGVSLATTSPLTTVWGKIEAITGRDALAANQFSSIVTHRITVRYNPLFSGKQQVWFKGRVFQVEAVLNPDERNKLQYLLCVEINDSAGQVSNQPAGLD